VGRSFESAVLTAVADAGAERLRQLAAGITAGLPPPALRAGGGPPVAADAVDRIVAAMTDESVPPQSAIAYLLGVAAGYEHRAARVQTELAWTGPVAFDVPVRATAQVLADLVNEAETELILTTYSARPYPPLRTALQAAVDRGANVWIVVETLHGAGSALQGDQPAVAFAGLAGVQLWTWAINRRPQGAKMHAKLAVADERTLFVSSANLTTSGIGNNIEAGLLVCGGSAARRAAEHLRALRRDQLLVRL
jgi:phosphatidylserine/phosphatidylglycerophosphate/cardiolipin synthase-like enzyme